MASRTVTYTLRADTDNFESGLKKSRNSAADFFKALERDSDRFFAGQKNAGKALESWGLPVGMIADGFKVAAATAVAFGAAVVGAFVLSNKALLDYSDKIVTLHQRTGQSTASLQVLGHMAKVSGTDVESLAKAVTKMEVNLGKGDDAFKKLGLSVSTLKALSPDAAFAKVGAAIGGIVDPMQRASAAVAVFGKSGAELLPLFAMDLAKAKNEATSLGLVLDGELLSASEALGDAIDTTQSAAMKFGERLAGIVQQSPGTILAVESMGVAFGVMSEKIDKNSQTIQKWANIAALALSELAASTATALGMVVSIGKAGMFGWAVELSGVEKLTDGLKQMTQSFQDALLAKIKWANTDMGGAGVLLPGGKLPTQGTVGGTFNGGAAPKEIKVQELKVTLPASMARDLFNPAGGWNSAGTLSPGQKNYNLWGDSSKFLPPELEGNIHVAGEGAKFLKASTETAAQALQNFANLAALSTSKLGKSLATVFGSGSGLADGINGLKGAKNFLGQLGAVGTIATAGIGIISGIVGLFKKKPKEPVPPPPQQVSAEAWNGHVNDQLSKGTAGLAAAIGGIKIGSVGDMTAQASIAGQQFWAVFKTQGIMAAAASVKDVLGKLVEQLGQYGSAAAQAILGPIQAQVALAGNEMFAGAAEGAKGFADVLASQVNARMPMSIAQFDAYGQQASAAFEQAKASAIDQGMSIEAANAAAFGAVGPLIQTIIDAAAQYGITLDSNTQDLLELATANGVAFSTTSTDRLIMSVDALTLALGGVPPAVNAIRDSINGIPTGRQVNVRVHYSEEGGIRDPTRGGEVDGDIPGFAGGSGGLRDFGTGRLAMLHGREAVVTEDEYRERRQDRLAEGGGDGVSDSGVGEAVHEISTSFQAFSEQLGNLADSMAALADRPSGNVQVAPVINVSTDFTAVRANKEALMDELQGQIADAIKAGTSPIIYQLEKLGFVRS